MLCIFLGQVKLQEISLGRHWGLTSSALIHITNEQMALNKWIFHPYHNLKFAMIRCGCVFLRAEDHVLFVSVSIRPALGLAHSRDSKDTC